MYGTSVAMLALMPDHTNFTLHLTQSNSFTSVLKNLSLLDEQFGHYKLDRFVVFNRAYAVVTHEIQKGVHENYFANPAFIENFTSTFAQYYFQVVADVLLNRKVPAAWDMLSKTTNNPRFISLLMGANAHINHDLPLVLDTLIKQQDKNELIEDILKVDKLLMKSGKEIIGLFDEPNKYLNFLKHHFQFLYYRPVMYIILGWRISAWRSYKDVEKNGLGQSTYQRKSIRIANRLLRLGKLLYACNLAWISF